MKPGTVMTLTREGGDPVIVSQIALTERLMGREYGSTHYHRNIWHWKREAFASCVRQLGRGVGEDRWFRDSIQRVDLGIAFGLGFRPCLRCCDPERES